jgi:hypothetical protein
MWIFCKLGFFSAVQHRDKPDILLVRGRFGGDLERLLSSLSPEDRDVCSAVAETPNADYLYRLEMPKRVFAKAVGEIAEEINSDNFKDSVHEGNRSPRDLAYIGCWSELRTGQIADALTDSGKRGDLRNEK